YGGTVIDQNFANTSPDDLPEVAIFMEKGADGVFNNGDYILFYAQGIVKWTYNAANRMFQHEGNPYSTYGCYFVTSDAGAGKKIALAPAETSGTSVQEITEFTDFKVYEKDEVSLIESGKEFYGEKFDTKLTYDFTFNFPDIVSSAGAKMRVMYATNASTSSKMIVSFNGKKDTLSTSASNNESKYIETTKVLNYTNVQSNSTVQMTYLKQSTWLAYLNYLEINARCLLKMNGSSMRFQNFDTTTAEFKKYNISEAGSNVIVWDISDNANVQQMPATRSGQTLTFTTAAENRYFIALDPSANYPKPEMSGNVANQNLHALSQVDLTMIVYPTFLEEANTLAAAHQQIDGMKVAIVTPEQVYNEFSSGAPDISAYRKLMRMQYDRDSANHKPKYLLLFGRGSFDNRGLLRETAGNNLILTYQADNSGHTVYSYVTDDYIGMMVDNAVDSYIKSNRIDIATGRFPVTTREQAQSVVNKTIEYMRNQRRGNWKNQLVYLADDGEIKGSDSSNDYKNYMVGQEDIINQVISVKHPEYQVNKIYIDAFKQVTTANGSTYPEAKAKLASIINSGTFFFNYLGHAGANGLTGEGILLADDIKKLTNKNYFLCFTGTCDFIHFDVPRVSAGEFLLTNPVGGSIGILAASRTVYESRNKTLSQNFNYYLFDKDENGKHYTIGQVIILAKNRTGNDNNNKLSYVYMGDPAVTLNYPDKYGIKTTEINGNTEIAGNDTLKALSINSIKGIIIDENSAKVENFSGNIFVNIYDKMQTITTLDNDGRAEGNPFKFQDRPNLLYSGKTKVENGEFEVTFMMPKDIHYNFGTGRINYYAEMDSVSEAQGYFENFIVGGSSNVQIGDNEGPVIENMYFNSPDFTNGSKTNETPYFVVSVSDEHGINTVGNGIGHDVTLMVDNDPTKIYILNEYYTADAGTYQSGTFAYLMPELEEGKHSVKFKVWDLLNNSSDAGLDFEVQKGLKPQIFDLYCYPNPATDYTIFRINTDRPQDVLLAKIEIFDLVGRKIWEFSQTTTEDIRWNMRSQNGTLLSTGIYIYRLTLSTLNSATVSKSNKLIIKKQ
ncbi:MAG: type IX secretion system sortase PorU, partial [Prevotellaceae bacterium]|nr:type IX secretion system sortase PorU [Prevotellaceae bacterium]